MPDETNVPQPTPPPDPHRTARKLQEAGAPPELAEQICAIATEHAMTQQDVENWVNHPYKGREWTGESFRRFARQAQQLRISLDMHYRAYKQQHPPEGEE